MNSDKSKDSELPEDSEVPENFDVEVSPNLKDLLLEIGAINYEVTNELKAELLQAKKQEQQAKEQLKKFEEKINRLNED
jgi:hypothetical protein